MELKKGTILGNYKLLAFKGKGSTAEVWSAIKIKTNQEFALKIFAPDIALDDSSKTLLKEEYEKTKKLYHPYIINPLDHFEFDGRPVLVFKLCKNSLWEELKIRLTKRLKSNETSRLNLFSERELAQILLNISDALKYLHSAKLIHHDVKPANILLNDENGNIEYSLSDFGITKEVRETIIRQTKAKSNSLTLAYAAPERLRGELEEQVKSDIFSLGASIFELTNTIKIPPGEILNNNGMLEEISGNYSKGFKNLIKNCLKKDYNERIDADEIYYNAKYFLENESWPESLGVEDNRFTQIQRKEIHTNQQQPTVYYNGESYSPDTENSFHTNESSIWKKIKIPVAIIFILTAIFFGYQLLFNNDIQSKIICKNGYQIVQTKNNKCGVINKDGKWVQNPKYKTCVNLIDSILLISDNGKNIFLIK